MVLPTLWFNNCEWEILIFLFGLGEFFCFLVVKRDVLKRELCDILFHTGILLFSMPRSRYWYDYVCSKQDFSSKFSSSPSKHFKDEKTIKLNSFNTFNYLAIKIFMDIRYLLLLRIPFIHFHSSLIWNFPIALYQLIKNYQSIKKRNIFSPQQKFANSAIISPFFSVISATFYVFQTLFMILLWCIFLLWHQYNFIGSNFMV